MVFDPLFFFRRDDRGAWGVAPGLIERWDFSSTEPTAIWQLRKGVTFHDGSPWNADSLKWNIERMITDPKSLAASVLGNLDPKNPLTIVAPYTVKISLVSMFHLSESAFHGLPSWKVTPLRSCQMAVGSVDEKSQRSIKPGATPHAPRSSRRKKKSGSNTMKAAEPLAEL